MDDPSPQAANIRPHPLALECIGSLSRGARVLELGSGRGRNTAALEGAGLSVYPVEDRDVLKFEPQTAGYDAVLSTHGFLHGRSGQIALLLRRTAMSLREGCTLYATFASTRDARFGQGDRLGEQTFAPQAGDEAGVPHTYYSEIRLRELLEPYFHIQSPEEREVGTIVGAWAHAEPPRGRIHWFIRAARR